MLKLVQSRETPQVKAVVWKTAVRDIDHREDMPLELYAVLSLEASIGLTSLAVELLDRLGGQVRV